MRCFLGDLTIRARVGQVVVRAGKGNKYRTVPLNASVRTVLVSCLAERWGVEDTLEAVLASWDEHDPAAPLWVSQKGRALHVAGSRSIAWTRRPSLNCKAGWS
ncbi:MAG TPA: hypothetical protein VFS21_11480 [Roseiflexaceae bacterium]|nr:hypothetical protein [Roseiflexaceae bacterium]